MHDDNMGDPVLSRLCLIFFRQVGKKTHLESMENLSVGYWLIAEPYPPRFPIHPHEATCMCYVLFDNFGTFLREADSGEYLLEKQNPLEAVYDLLHMDAVRECQKIYSIHPKSMLLRMYRWAALRQGYTQSQITNEYNRLHAKMIDLCEQFHYPAILRYEERRDFNLEMVNKILGVEPKEHQDRERAILSELVEKVY